MRRPLAIVGLIVALALPAAGQERAQTLADIRQELSVLYVEIQKLKRELNTTQSPQVQTGGATLLDRINTIEAELKRLTGRTEELEYRVARVAEDGANRVGDLEFRLCELEEGCDIGSLPEQSTLGGGAAAETVASPIPQPAPDSTAGGTQLAENERADFEAASGALDAGEFAQAAELFSNFNQTYPGGPLAVAAELRRGEALEGLGDTREAARAYLEGFRIEQQGQLAGEALFRLGRALGQLGQKTEACATLGEVGNRFPGDAAVIEAQDEMIRIGCG